MTNLDSYDQFLKQTLVPIRLSCINPSGFPLVISLWYHYKDGFLYCATSAGAKIVKFLENNTKCGFEVAADTPPYCGIRGYGIVDIFPDKDHKIMNKLYSRYISNKNTKLFEFLNKENRSEVVIRIEIERLFDWNYEERMSDIIPKKFDKVCPKMKN